MPGVIRLVFIVSLLQCVAATTGIAMLLYGGFDVGSVHRAVLPPSVTAIVALVSCGALAFGIWTERRYTRLLATVAFTAQPLVAGDYSWRTVLAAGFFLFVALWFLYWDDSVTDYYILLGDRTIEDGTARS